jgi:type IV pilus assembly protein PilM
MFNSTKYPIGLDISDNSLKLIQLKKAGGFKLAKKQNSKAVINCYNALKMPDGLIINGEIKDENEVVKQINKLISTTKGDKLNTKEVMTVLPAKQTFIKLIQIPVVPQEEIADKINAEIVKHIPLVLDDVYLDWQLINTKKNLMNILVGTAPKKIVNQYTEVLTKASLQPRVLEIEAASICRCLIREPENNKNEPPSYLVIDLGANRSSVILCSSKAVYLTVSSPIAGGVITKQIADSLNINMQKAEKAKKVCGLSKDKCKGATREILDDMINNLIDYIEQATLFFQSNYPEKQIQEVILCGGGANFLEIDKILFEHLKIPIVKGNPWLRIKKEDNDTRYNQLNNNSLSYVTAMGLALRGIMANDE